MDSELHTPVNLLAEQEAPVKKLLNDRLQGDDSMLRVYYSRFNQPEYPHFPDYHPMARVNHMLGELTATAYLLYGVMFAEASNDDQNSINARFQPMANRIDKLSRSLRYEMTADARAKAIIPNCCTNPAEWSRTLEDMVAHLQELEHFTQNMTLDANSNNNAILGNFLEGPVCSHLFRLIGKMERDVNQWNADVVQPMPTSKQSNRRFREINETIVGAAIADPHSTVVKFEPPKKQR